MDDKRQKPGLLVALLAMLGIYSLPQVAKMQGSEPVVRRHDAEIIRSWHGVPEAEEPQERDRRDLRPLLEFLAEGDAKPSDTADLHEYLDRKLSRVRCLVVTVPDPVESVASTRFDEFLDVVQRGIELQEFVLDRTLLPWEPATKDRESALDRTSRIRWDRLGLDFHIDTTRLVRQDRARPGLMVFKKALLPGSEPPSTPTVVLAFLVRESPILGVEKEELARSLDLIDQFFYHKLTGEREQVLTRRASRYWRRIKAHSSGRLADRCCISWDLVSAARKRRSSSRLEHGRIRMIGPTTFDSFRGVPTRSRRRVLKTFSRRTTAIVSRFTPWSTR